MEAQSQIGQPENMMNQDQYWEAIGRRDRSQDGAFFYGVMTTGVYCRPSCPSRRPLRQNVRFYATAEEAERDGLRPCLRCRPLQGASDPAADRIRQLCRYLETHPEQAPDLADLAARAGLSRFHLQRSFKAVAGVTPKQYLEACRMRKLKSSLRHSSDVADAVYDAGFGSSSRVYERADTRLGMTPNQYRQGGRGVNITHVTVDSPLGLMMIGATDRGLCFVQFGESAEGLLTALRKEYPASQLEPMATPHPPEFQKWIDALTSHLSGNQPRLDLPLDIRATAFQMRVWNYLQSIPYGEVQSYAEVAGGIGQPSATRAVARACAGNTVALVIPCHRVIRGTGELGGYRWGLDRKRALIDLERKCKASA
jgi:AraC family transcriptional regulator, regulatory protein of adaptative response / methylated-DNA-[protein]-cysteine methyltransferase